jgi:beta-lactam-binding protein with PASTA domain
VVSSGPCSVIIQSVIGMSQGAATATLQGQGLNVAAFTASTGCSASNTGIVVSQNPGGGVQSHAGATVSIGVCPQSPPTTTSSTTTTTTAG